MGVQLLAQPDGADADWRRDHSWSDRPWDICWLDCPDPGYRKQWHRSEICLCAQHAWFLEEGYLGATYSGAPLPPGSRAGCWPWRPLPDIVIQVVPAV